MRLPACVLGAVCLLAALDARAVETGVVGTWRGPENSVISIAPCGSTLCAKVLSTGNETAAHIDTNNPDAALRTRPLCGLQIGEGFHGTDPNKAEGGHLYDPRSGKTYKGNMTSQGDVLLLRGYIGVSMFGKTARWERVTAPVEMCKNTQPAGKVAAPAQPVPAPAASAPAGAGGAAAQAPGQAAPSAPPAQVAPQTSPAQAIPPAASQPQASAPAAAQPQTAPPTSQKPGTPAPPPNGGTPKP